MPARPNDKRRQQLLDELEAIVLKEGFRHLRVGVLAERLHCSRSTLYKLADTKDDLIELIFARYTERGVAEGIRIAEQSNGSPAEKIMVYSGVIDRLQSLGSDTFWRDVRATPQVFDVLSERRGRGYRYVVKCLKEGIDSGEFRPMNTAWIGHLVWLCAVETRDPDTLERLGIDHSEAGRELIDLIIYGLRTDKTSGDVSERPAPFPNV